ncbi:CHAT domain-containing protein [Azorhizobium sp. AG788]|uniref:CHAT domain-containing tetratricopeptide repeat protein n=1 Tax=Azorhizobium sp. AG788 TaxID=2183897 RepID=UPI00105DEBD6|nr:CHAT domain-containing tetratricopeptide repeat protein [Azorhizobium sp. AG788]TDT92813.1 CHAT domain-containing protein [Azorhizobium sp. AG788]
MSGRLVFLLRVAIGVVALSAGGAALAQTAGGTTQAMKGCERLLAEGKVQEGYPCLRDVLKTIATGSDDARTLQEYRTWAEAFLQARQPRLAAALYEDALASRAASGKPLADLGRLHFAYSYYVLSRGPDKERAITHARAGLDILEKTLGPGAYDTVAARDNLAVLLSDSGAIAPGLNLAESNFDIALKSLGEDEPLTWRVSNNFAEALRSIGRPEAAVPIDQVLLAKRVKHYGEGSIQALVSASNLALSYLEMGDKAQAMRYFRLQGRFGAKLADPTSEHEAQAKAWYTYTDIFFSPDPQLKPDMLEALMGLKDWRSAPDLMRVKASELAAKEYERQGKVRQGLALRQAAYEISAASFSARSPITFDALLGLARAHVRNQEPEKALATFRDLDRQLYDWTLREVGTAGNRFIAETTRVLADNFLYEFGRFALEEPSARPAFADAAGRWKALESGQRARLRQMADTLPDDVKPLAQEVIRLLGRQQEVLSERRTAAERRDDEALVQDVQKKSGELSARLASLKVPEPPPLDAAIAGALGPKDALVNFVLITRRQGTRSSDAAIEDQRLLAVVRRHDQPPQLLDLGSFPDIVARLKVGQEGTDTAKEMYAALFGKLSGALGGGERLFIVPDAELYGIPFAALRDGEGRFLDQLYEVRLLTREDALPTAVRRDRLAPGGKAVLAGGLDFSSGKQKGPRALPATGREVAEVGKVLAGAGYATSVLTGAAGTEQALHQAIPGASVVHLATHGFFEPPHDGLSALWRGGIVLARAGDDKPPKANDRDGYLYAEELMGWDLSAADLVVLSACETAVGDRSAVSAIRGLPTALAIAGARRSLLTLWPVADAGAANFMIAFYRHAAEPGATFSSALRQTRLDAIAGKVPQADDPEVWASFVMYEG